MATLILAGGESRRMGCPKARLDLGGEPMAVRIARQLEGVSPPALLVAGRNAAAYRDLGLGIVQDRVPGEGPIAGIEAGLRAAGPGYHVVVSCDQPFAAGQLLSFLLERARRAGKDAVVPRVEGRLAGLQAVYAATVAETAARLLRAGVRRVADLLEALSIEVVEERELARFGSPRRIFFNVNTPDDLETARRWDAQKPAPGS